MNKRLEEAKDVFLDRVNQICNKFGFNNAMAQLYAILYLSDEALSLDDMSERLKISKASASINIRALERYGTVRRVWIRGSRKDYYEAEVDIAKVVMDRIKALAKMRLLEVDNMIKFSLEVVNSGDTLGEVSEDEPTKIFKDRLEKLANLRAQAQLLFDLFNSGILEGLLNSKINESSQKEAIISSN